MGKWLEMLKAETSQSVTEQQQKTKPTIQGEVFLLKPDIPPPESDTAIVAAMERVCSGLKILPSEFRTMIEGDEAGWIASGRIPVKTARAYAQLFADELACDPLHYVNCNMVTCWACSHYRMKQCQRWRTSHSDLWHRCDDFKEVSK